ncbi:hypothetical protein HDV04_004833 [Boothiomyces sp. JEL0838]|nr:hypothetical protein HDV04_004833 [Boothiomyces sp. JEL0838]
MLDKSGILRSHCNICECTEYVPKSKYKCACNCINDSHKLADDIPGVFHKQTVVQSRQDFDLDFKWLNIGGVVSVTWLKCQKQVAMGILGGLALAASSILTPSKLLLYFPKLFPLYFNTAIVFAITALIAYKTFQISLVKSKRVVSAILLTLNMFMVGIYVILAFGITPRIPGFSGLCYIEPARYLAWFVVLPVYTCLIGDVTTNESKMNINTKIIYGQYMSMFLAQVLTAYYDFLLLGEFILCGCYLYRTHLLFRDALQYAWLMKTGLFLSSANAEYLMSAADAIAIGGLTLTVSFSKMKELKEL